MSERLPGLDRERALIAAKSCAAVVIGYALALSFEWKASSVATTIVILQTSAVGSTLQKASMRILGTLAGAVIGLLLVALCAHNRDLFLLAMALLTGACVWGMQGSSNQYAWMLVVVTTAVVGWPAATDPLNTFPTMVERVTVVVIGVILASLAHCVFWPITATAQFECSMRNLFTGCRDLLSSVREGLDKHALDGESVCKSNADLMKLAESLDGKLSSARQESKRIRLYFGRYRQLSNRSLDLVLATGAIADASVQYLRGRSEQELAASSETVDRTFDELIDSLDVTIDQLSRLRDGSEQPLPSPSQPSTSDDQDELDPIVSVVISRTRHLERIAADARRSLAGLEDPEATVPSDTPATTPSPAPLPRLRKAAIASGQVLLSAYFFIALNWPAGLQAGMLLVMVVAFLNAQLPVALPIRAFIKGTLIALPVAMIFYFLIMPRTDSFTALALWLALMFFPFLYSVASHHPLTSIAATLGILLANALVSISTTPPSYNFASFVTMYLGLLGGFGVSLLLAYVLETRNPRLAFLKLLTSVLDKSANHIDGLADLSLPAADRAAMAESYRKETLPKLSQLHKLPVVAWDGQDLRTSQAQIQSVAQAVDLLAMRMIWSGLEPVSLGKGILKKSERELLRHAGARCVETLKGSVEDLRDFRVSDARPDHDSSDQFAGSTRSDHSNIGTALRTYYDSLEDAIDQCGSKLAAVNWKRWCADHF